jgi:hypothetical protein
MRPVIVLATSALWTGAVFAACGSDDTDTGWVHSAGSAGTAGSDASAGAGGSSGGAGHAGTGGQPQGGAAGQAGTAGAAQGGAGGAAQGGAAGAAEGGAAGYQCGDPGGSAGEPGTGPCSFPQGVPDPGGFIAWSCAYGETDPAVDGAVNAVMANLTGCGVSSDCDITGFAGTTTDEICQSWFAAVTEQLRGQGYCAGQHNVGGTDEIAVSNTGCAGKWYGYHICNYGGPKLVWNPGARRGWWMIDPQNCF